MSLSEAQRRATKAELQEAFERSGKTEDEACAELGCSPAALRCVMDLNADALEDAWILRDYFADAAHGRGVEPVRFSALAGDPADYWFLDADRIHRRDLATRV